jgi:uncharacterized protein (DUF2236 family)
LEELAADFLKPKGLPAVDFTRPGGEPALIPADSIAWQVFRNPLALFVGGVAAVILELAEPRVRAGVWEHSSFRTDPVERLRRTGLAAMVTVYGARSTAEDMIAGVRQVHDRIEGRAETGEPYRANDPELLDWVQATALFGFLHAYHRFVRPLAQVQRDRFYREGRTAGRLYGAVGTPRDEAELDALFAAMKPKLTASPVIFEFLRIMRRAPVLPLPLRPIQHMLVRAAVEILPAWFRDMVGLSRRSGLRPWEPPLMKQAGILADRVRLDASPAAEASVRLGLPRDYLWKAASIHSSSPA